MIDSNENSNKNLDSSNNFISIMTRGDNPIQMSRHLISVGYFLLGGKKKFNSIGDREWNDLCKRHLKPGSLTDIPYLVRTSALLKPHHANCIRSPSIIIQ